MPRGKTRGYAVLDLDKQAAESDLAASTAPAATAAAAPAAAAAVGQQVQGVSRESIQSDADECAPALLDATVISSSPEGSEENKSCRNALLVLCISSIGNV